MSFALIDRDGTTLETFEDRGSLVGYLRARGQQEPSFAEDLAVLEYANGERIGVPILAPEFAAPADRGAIRPFRVAGLTMPTGGIDISLGRPPAEGWIFRVTVATMMTGGARSIPRPSDRSAGTIDRALAGIA